MSVASPLLDRIDRALAEIEEYPLAEPSYGNFYGGDPRDFWPDQEACTRAEIIAWMAACTEWHNGNQVTFDDQLSGWSGGGLSIAPTCGDVLVGWEPVTHYNQSPFGIGTTTATIWADIEPLLREIRERITGGGL